MCYHGTLVSLIFLKKNDESEKEGEGREGQERQSRWAERHPYLTRLKREEQKTVPLITEISFKLTKFPDARKIKNEINRNRGRKIKNGINKEKIWKS